MNNNRHARFPGRARARRGIALPITMIFVLIIAVMGVSFLSLSVTSSNIADRGYQKTQATVLAESGVHAMYASIANRLRGGATTFPDVSSTALSSTFSGTTRSDGTFTASVLSITPSTNQPVYNAQNQTTGYTDTYTFVVEGVGTAPNGATQSRVRATFVDMQTQTISPGVGQPYTFNDGALVSNGNILLQGSMKTVSAVTVHGAGARANGVVSQNGGSYSVDGPIAVAPESYAASLAALGTSPNCYGGAVTNMGGAMQFPDAATIATWQSTWYTQARETTPTYSTGHIVTGNFNPSKGNSTLTAPAYITGDIIMDSGCNLTIQPDTAATAPYVVYVHGNVTYTNGNGSITNKGVMIICDGIISESSNCNYECTDTTKSGLVSLNPASNAISLAAGGTAVVGFVYAVNGGVQVSGNGNMTGAVISGQTGANGGISLQGTPTIIYPGGMNASFIGLPPADVISISKPYTPTNLSKWVQTL
jgi:Tfp pilus assembly protein PilX